MGLSATVIAFPSIVGCSLYPLAKNTFVTALHENMHLTVLACEFSLI